MKRLTTDGSVLQIPRTKDKCYLYADPSINPNSNKINHYLKIVDFYLQAGKPGIFVIEPEMGCYEPDIYYEGSSGPVCVEIQITPISTNKMQKKIDDFVKEYGKTHNAKKIMICSDYDYKKVKVPGGFHLVRQGLPKEIFF